MTNQFSHVDPQRHYRSQSELEMQTLFAHYLPVVPLPVDFATQLKQRVLAEVALVMQPQRHKPLFLMQGCWFLYYRPTGRRTAKLLLLALIVLCIVGGGTIWLLGQIDSGQEG